MKEAMNAETSQDAEPAAAPACESPCHWPRCKIVIDGITQCDEGRDCNSN